MKYDVDDDGSARFWEFVHERQEIYRRRFIEKQKSPWMSDKHLQERHFCNVYRNLDRVTKFYIDTYVGEGDPEEAFLTTLIFRIVNNPETMEVIGPQHPDTFDYEKCTHQILEAGESAEIETSTAPTWSPVPWVKR